MTRGLSIWLDVLRCAAALAVLFGHLAHTRFTGGDLYVLREINLASDAVVVFFVISGLVIAFAADRDGSAATYAFHRMTRVLSVVVPALVLTLILDAFGTRIDPSAYPDPYYQPASAADFLLRGATLTTEWTGVWDRVRLGTNGPLWSLSYEVAYYTLFGVAVFCRGLIRLGLLAIVAFLVGIPVLALLPAWLLGVLVWKVAVATGTTLSHRAPAYLLAILPIALLIAARAMNVPNALTAATAAAFAPTSHHAILGYSDEVLWNMLLSLGVAVHLLGVSVLARAAGFTGCAWGVKAIRWFAGATFSIYAVHYPVLHVLDALLPGDVAARGLLLLLCTLAVCLVFAEIFERPIAPLRQMLRRLIARASSNTARFTTFSGAIPQPSSPPGDRRGLPSLEQALAPPRRRD